MLIALCFGVVLGVIASRTVMGSRGYNSHVWSSTGSALVAQLELTPLVDGQIIIPDTITHIIIEVGCNGHHVQWNSPPPVRIPGIDPSNPISKQQHVLLVSFEPLLDKWAYYLSQGKLSLPKWKGDVEYKAMERPVPPTWAVPGRLLVLPFAINSDDSQGRARMGEAATFHVAESDGCSSLLEIDGAANIGNQGLHMPNCVKQNSARQVPVVSLETVVRQWLGNRFISFAKIDAQGVDLQVVQSAGSAVSRFGSFRLEVVGDDCHLPYKDHPRCSDIVAGMSALGFESKSNCSHHRRNYQGRNTCGADFHFVNVLGASAHDDKRVETGQGFPRPLVRHGTGAAAGTAKGTEGAAGLG